MNRYADAGLLLIWRHEMNRILFDIVLVLIIEILGFKLADAATGGRCIDCHVMHNSQDGALVAADGANFSLLKDSGMLSSCISCHTSVGISGAPLIDADESNYTAGGSFSDVWVTSSTRAHNVEDLTGFNAGSGDSILGNKAPGGVDLGAQMLKCAGTYGCHGSHDNNPTSEDGIKGYHHGSNAYRFLEVAANNTGPGIAVGGRGSPDWEKGGATTSNHNLYLSDEINGISKFCDNCHNAFHAVTQNGDAWIRHPTDVSVNLLSGDAAENLIYNPYAFTGAIISGMSNFDMTGYDDNGYDPKVMCLSCHRAHASQYPDILRFDYASQSAGSGGTTGCLGCHPGMR